MNARPSIVIYSNIFPKPSAPHDGMFTAQLVIALAKIAKVSVVCPISWRVPKSKIPESGEYKGIRVYYPRFFYIPAISRIFNGLLQAIAVTPLLRRLRKEESVELINAHFLYPDGVSAAIACRILNIPLVVTALGSDVNVLTEKIFIRRQIVWACGAAQQVTAVSAALNRRIAGLGIDESKLAYTPNGVNTDLFTIESKQKLLDKLSLSFSPETKLVIFVGGLRRVKGLDILLQALSQLRAQEKLNFHTLLVGDGPEKKALVAFAEQSELREDITFVGAVDHDRIPDWLCVADAFCLPSRMEGQPNAILEALASGLPVIASSVGGIPDLIGRDNGILFEAGDSSDLAESLSTALSRTWDREKIRKSVPCSSWDEAAQNYLALFSSLIEAP